METFNFYPTAAQEEVSYKIFFGALLLKKKKSFTSQQELGINKLEGKNYLLLHPFLLSVLSLSRRSSAI